MKKTLLFLVTLSLAVCLVSCTGEKKELTCDGCGKTVDVSAKSQMTDDWILFCDECGEPEIDFDNE